MLFTNKEKKGG